jgi:hypothetical protein
MTKQDLPTSRGLLYRTTGICKFCDRDKHPLVKVAGKEAQICDECVYIAQVVWGNIARGSVRCPACQSTGGFSVLGENGVRSKFTLVGQTKDGMVLYYPADSSVGSISSRTKPHRVSCTDCDSVVPNWSISHNVYLSFYYDTSDNPPPSNKREPEVDPT